MSYYKSELFFRVFRIILALCFVAAIIEVDEAIDFLNNKCSPIQEVNTGSSSLLFTEVLTIFSS